MVYTKKPRPKVVPRDYHIKNADDKKMHEWMIWVILINPITEKGGTFTAMRQLKSYTVIGYKKFEDWVASDDCPYSRQSVYKYIRIWKVWKNKLKGDEDISDKINAIGYRRFLKLLPRIEKADYNKSVDLIKSEYQGSKTDELIEYDPNDIHITGNAYFHRIWQTNMEFYKLTNVKFDIPVSHGVIGKLLARKRVRFRIDVIKKRGPKIKKKY